MLKNIYPHEISESMTVTLPEGHVGILKLLAQLSSESKLSLSAAANDGVTPAHLAAGNGYGPYALILIAF